MTSTICVDAGTTLVKAVVFDGSGVERVVVRRPAVLEQPHPGWSEQHLPTVLEAVLDCLAEAVAKTDEPVGHVAITAQGDGAWMVDAHGTPVRDAVLWNDARAHAIVEQWTEDGRLEQAFRINGSLGNLGLPHAIMAWFAEHDRDVLRRTSSVLTCGSWLFGSLTGVWGLHRSEASAPWLDAQTGEVSAELLALYGLTEWGALVPRVLNESELTSPLRPELANRTGLPVGTPVTLAPYDVVATAAGSASLQPGDGFCILGTTICTGAVIDRADTSGVPSGLTLLADQGQPVIRAFPSLAGIGVMTWLARVVGLKSAPEVLELAAHSPSGAHGVRVWPYLSPAGERAPFLDPQARGVLAGLSLSTQRADLARGTLEGLAHVVADCAAAVGRPITILRTSGGGSGSDLWCQTIADVVGIPVHRPVGSQIGAKGALLYAAVAAGHYPDLNAAAADLLSEPETFDPDPSTGDLHRQRQQEFLDSRAALAQQWGGWVDDREEPVS